MNIGNHQESIVCPSCGAIQSAIVEHTHPFWTYVHNCRCGYVIMESEWENSYITAAEIEMAKEKLSPQVFAKEYEIAFCGAEGGADV